MQTLKNLSLAFLNATLLLVLAILVVALLLLGQVNDPRGGLSESITTHLRPVNERLERIETQLTQMNETLKSGDDASKLALGAEIAAMRAQLPDVSGLSEIGAQDIARQFAIVVGEQLTALGAK